MSIIKQIGGVSIITLFSTSAFALGAQDSDQTHDTPPKNQNRTDSTLPAKPPVILEDQSNKTAATVRPIRRVVIQPIETTVVRAASITSDTRFVYEFDETTNAMIYRPSETKTKPLPNKAEKEFP
jgi:hypothetical protein